MLRKCCLSTHPNLPVVISCCEASAVPGESAASDTVLVAAQRVDTLPGLTVPQLGAEQNINCLWKIEIYTFWLGYCKKPACIGSIYFIFKLQNSWKERLTLTYSRVTHLEEATCFCTTGESVIYCRWNVIIKINISVYLGITCNNNNNKEGLFWLLTPVLTCS